MIFDLDGTLIDSQRDLILSVNAMLREMGREELHEDTISGYIGHGAPQLVRRALAGTQATRNVSGHCNFPVPLQRAQTGQHARLSGRARSARTSLCLSDGRPDEQAGARQRAHSRRPRPRQIFRAVYGGNSFETKKPDPLGANTILREFAASPNEAILIGDSEVDVQTARNAGTLAAAVNYGFGTHDRAAYPADIYLDRLTDLVPLLGSVANEQTLVALSSCVIARHLADSAASHRTLL